MGKIGATIKTWWGQFVAGIRALVVKVLGEPEPGDIDVIADMPAGGNPYVNKDSRVIQRKTKHAAFMKRIRRRYNRISLKTSFALYVTFFLLLALALTLLSMTLFTNLRTELESNYYDLVSDDYIWYDIYGNGEVRFFYSDDYDDFESAWMNDFDLTIRGILRALTVLCIPVIFVVCIIAAGVLFYRNRLEPPIGILDKASQKIAERDLDFTISYSRNDELGLLCDSFEEMRQTLLDNYNEMWRQMEERRRLNNAFSHDLRTPLTVLKGNAHMLKEYLPQGTVSDEKIEGTVNTMQNHIVRMENYVEAMNRLQKLEDFEVNRREVDRREFTAMLKNIAEILAEGKRLSFYDDIDAKTLFIDTEIVMQVTENLLANAIRFAKSRIAVVCSCANGKLSISVSDDGPGFSPADLKLATNPFYKAKKNIYDEHFGLGLNISKILAERHGGSVYLSNVDAGGALVRAEFSE